MRAPSRRSLFLSLAVSALAVGLGLLPTPAIAADQQDLTGIWKLVRLSIVEAEEVSFDVKETDGKISASIAEPAPLRENPVKSFERKGDTVTVVLTIQGNEFVFEGKAADGKKYVGTFHVPNQLFPARLVKTDDKILARPQPPQDLLVSLNGLEQLKDPKAKVEKLGRILEGSHGDAKYSLLYAELVRYGTMAEEPPAKIRGYLDEWIKGAEPYGREWSLDVRSQALKVLGDKKPYADLALELAEQTQKQLTDAAPLELRADVAKALATAAKLAGKADLQASAEAQSKKLEAALDEDYHKRVPPFKPEASEGRKTGSGNRVVLLELFTGAQCPPCVAADVAFDALNMTYKPSELVTLQYHLHIPGPDPLTNRASLARQEYYTDLRGTPAAYFNGKLQPTGGGGMPQSKAKYDEYREVIDNFLNQKKRATVELQVDRSGDEIKITASAQTKTNGAKGSESNKEADSKDKEKEEIKLRVVLAEKQIKYIGGNRLRFHHHVVRAMPGGAGGKALTDGAGKVELTVKLSELRKELDDYLGDFTTQKGPFPNPRPPIELRNLTVVAFVQDDTSKTVLDAVSAPVADPSGEGTGE